ncbi:MAG: extracellular solute-binding protein [Geminicoccaceae bacterium]
MRSWCGVLVAAALSLLAAGRASAEPAHGIAMHGDPAYPADFAHFAYVDPNAPRGGSLVMAAIGSFDSLNSWIIRGQPASGLAMVYETLTTQSQDEAFTEYGLLAQSIEMPEDRSWVAFVLRPEARWHDGTPVTVDDVIFSLDILKAKGAPFYRAYYANVARAVPDGVRRVRFEFDGTPNRELPLIIGQMPILPKHYWEGRDFEKTTLEPPLGSGPYKVKSVDPGRTIVYERVPDYWGAALPVNVGRNNFDEVRWEYYRDPNVALEAFKAGRFDLRIESSSRFWATGYQGPALDKGLITKLEIPSEGGGGMQGFVFNLRRDKFKDRLVREALGYAFDFEWTNKTLFYGAYTRTASYFANTELASSGLPSPDELKLLEPYRDKLPKAVFDQEFQPPVTDGSGNNRDNLRRAVELFKQAGYEIKGGKLVDGRTGQPFTFEILLDSGGLFERIVGPFAKSLERLGIKVDLRTVDDAQYEQRLSTFDFDMVTSVFGQSLSPGNEQRDFWGSEAADQQGSRNLIGIKDPIVDELIGKIVTARSRDDLIAACRALDRVLLWSYYVIPQWHNRVTRIAYWAKLRHPETWPRYGVDLFAWWVDPAQATAVEAARRDLAPPAN